MGFEKRLVLVLAWAVVSSPSFGQGDFPRLVSVVEQMRTSRPVVSQSRFLLPDQLKIDFDYVLGAAAGLAEEFVAADGGVKRALEAVRAKKDSIDDHVRLALTIVKKGGSRIADELAAKVPGRFEFSGEPAGAYALGIAAGIEGAPAEARRALWQLALQTAYRSLMGKPDDEQVARLLMRAIEERASPAGDASVVSELVKVHPKSARFALWEACHQAGIFIGAEGGQRVLLRYADAAPRDYPKALEHAKVAVKGPGADRLAPAVFEWILLNVAFEQARRFSLAWREKERVVVPILDRLDALAAKEPLALAGLARVLAFQELENGPAALAAIEKLPAKARGPLVEKVAARMKVLAREQGVEGVAGAIFRRGGYTRHSQAVRVGVLPPSTVRVWTKLDFDGYVSVTLQVRVYSKAGDELVTVPAVAVVRPPDPVRDPLGHEAFDLQVPIPLDPAKIGSIEVSTSDETLPPDVNEKE